ncbi:MAG: aldehyde ferredoxin oxidoreductase family protein [bacterium]|nr:aldehyde ferredoxin oxidoreductase family protein [bacterium]
MHSLGSIENPKKVAIIDLTSKEVKIEEIPEAIIRKFLGGKGLAYYLLNKILKGTIPDPLFPENPIILMTGPLTGTGAPLSGRFNAVSRSPLTGLFGSSSCGGPFGIALKTCGFMGLAIKGASDKPVKIVIEGDNINIEPAQDLWGKTTSETIKALGPKPKDGTLVIGPAGENLVKYACIRSGERFLGRLGFGAVLGAKKIKAILVKHQNVKILPGNPRKLEKFKKQALEKIRKNHFTKLYSRFGTNTNILYSKEAKILPVKNFSQLDSPPEIYNNSGPFIEQNFELKPNPCSACSIVCGHKMKLDGRWVHVPEYETNALFGPNLLIFDIRKIAEINELCNELGLDTISTAVTIGYLMEAEEKGIVKSNLKFGDAEKVKAFIQDVAHKRGELATLAAEGSRFLSQKFGGKEFAIQVKGLELAAYDPRNSIGHGLSYSVANRGGCHLSAPLFPIEAYFGFMDPHKPKGKAEIVIFMENLFNVINSITTCVFTTFAYMLEDPVIKLTPRRAIKLFMENLTSVTIKFLNISVYKGLFEGATGINISEKELLKAGERIHLLERYLNAKAGLNSEEDTLPERFLKELKPVPLKEMLEEYYRKREYDASGAPKIEKLRRLGIEIY